MRVLALDYGDRRTGLAFSDMTCKICGAAFTVSHFNDEELLERLALEIASRDVGELVLGLPKNMDGTEGPRAEKSRAFKELLEQRFKLPVFLRDERRSTIEAHDILHSCGKKERAHRKNVDAVAATILLAAYLDEKKPL